MGLPRSRYCSRMPGISVGVQVTQNRYRHNSTREVRPPNTTGMRDKIVKQISPVGFIQAALSLYRDIYAIECVLNL